MDDTSIRVAGVDQGAGPHPPLVMPEMVLAAENAVGKRPGLLDPQRVCFKYSLLLRVIR